MTKVRDVYQALATLAIDGVCEAGQAQIMPLANISRRHLQRILRELIELGLIKIERVHHKRKTGNVYFILNRWDSQSPIGQEAMGLPESHRSGNDRGNGTPDGPSPPPMGLPESHCPAMHDSCMLHGEVERKNWILLDFLNEPERSARAAGCPPDLVAAWRELKDFRDQNEQWEPLGFKNPAGWINAQLKALHPPPPLQMPLPAGSFDVGEFKSRGMTKEEISARHPLSEQGYTLGEDGLWR